jgi:aminopeptidase YwaD
VLSGIFILGMITLPVMCLIQLIGGILGNGELIRLGTLGWLLLVFPIGPAILYAAFLNGGMKGGGVVPGAADNLSACGVVAAMSRYLANNPSELPDDTEIRFITFGSEEAGLRGSRRYVKAHLDELKALDARQLNYEIIAYPEIAIMVADVNGTLIYSPEMVSGAVAAALRAGIPYKIGSGGIGAGSDAAPFTWAGLKSITLLGFKTPQQQLAFYHQDRDTPDVLSIEPLLNALKLTLEWVKAKGE